MYETKASSGIRWLKEIDFEPSELRHGPADNRLHTIKAVLVATL